METAVSRDSAQQLMECLDATLYNADSSQLLEQETQLTLNWKKYVSLNAKIWSKVAGLGLVWSTNLIQQQHE